MTDELNYAYVQGPRSGFEQVELAKDAKGRVYRKHLLKYGSFPHPSKKGEQLVIDERLADNLIKNFEEGVCDIVQVPLANDENRHVEDPERNIGEVIALHKDADGLYADIDVRKPTAAEGIDNKTLLGISAMMHMNYTDTKSGKQVGPTLLHTLVTNRPYLTGLKGFEEVVAASVPGADTEVEVVPVFGGEADKEVVPVLVSREEETHMTTKEEALAVLAAEGIDVQALQNQVVELSANQPDLDEVKQDIADEVIGSLRSVLAGVGATNLSAGSGDEDEITMSDIAEAVIEVATEKASLEDQVAELSRKNEMAEQKAAEAEVDDLITKGRVLPVQREVMVELARTDRDKFDKLVPDSPIVKLSEEGVTVHEDGDSEKRQQLEEDIERLSNLANEEFGGAGKTRT
jgi:hypothetical protein